MMMSPQSQRPYLPNSPGIWIRWECKNCHELNDPQDSSCRNCGRQWAMDCRIVTIGIITPPSAPSSWGSHGHSHRAFRVGVVISLLLIVLPLVGVILRIYVLQAPQVSTSTPVPGVHGGNTLYKGEWLKPGDYLLSSNGRYDLEFQLDGNLVEYDRGDHNRPIWESNTANKGAVIVELQLDGNLVIYPNNRGYMLFATGTNVSRYGTTGDRLVVQNNATIDIYDVNGRVLWWVRPS